MNLKRNGAEEFIWLLEQCRRGRLWLLVGQAPGAGQTRRLLEEAHYLRSRGLDVVVAWADLRVRPELAALAQGLEALSPRRVEYRGMTVEEMDLAAVLARRPQVAVVDDLAHANAPGASYAKRWQDVAGLQAAGISVLGAACLGDLEGAAGPGLGLPPPDPRRSLPEGFWRLADQLESVDTPGQEAAAGLAGVARQAGAARQAGPAPAASPERVMVCLASAKAPNLALLERGRRLAARLGAACLVVHVETPQEEAARPDDPGATPRNWQAFAGLGAEVVRLKGKDPVKELMDFARAQGVGHIVMGRSERPWWRQVFGRSPLLRMVQEAAGLDLHVVSAHEDGEQA